MNVTVTIFTISARPQDSEKHLASYSFAGYSGETPVYSTIFTCTNAIEDCKFQQVIDVNPMPIGKPSEHST